MSITGYFSYKGLTIMQNPNIESVFEKLLIDLKPSKVLEIGTSSGGLTLMIRDLLDKNNLHETILTTYDVNEPKTLINHVNNGSKINVLVENIFNHNYDELINPDYVIDFIKSEGTTLVICDGGSKKNEFNILSNFLKKGDVIMAHDYSPNEKYFNEKIKGKIWNWLEIQDSDIDNACITNNLHPYMENEFKNVVWVCKIKK